MTEDMPVIPVVPVMALFIEPWSLATEPDLGVSLSIRPEEYSGVHSTGPENGFPGNGFGIAVPEDWDTVEGDPVRDPAGMVPALGLFGKG
jgi:hypothetical protein